MMNLRNFSNKRYTMITPATRQIIRNQKRLLLALILACLAMLLYSYCARAEATTPATWPNPPAYCLTQGAIETGEYCDFAILRDIQPMQGANKFNLILEDQYGFFTLPYASNLLASHLASHKGELFLTQGDFINDSMLSGWRLYSAKAYAN